MKIRALIVEDTPDHVLLLLGELGRAGLDMEAHTVDDAETFRARIAENWDIVLSDYSVPGFGGMEALRLVRELRPELPFILVSGVISEEVAVEAMRHGAADFVLKSNLSRLAPAVRREVIDGRMRRDRSELRTRLALMEGRLRETVERAPIGICHGDAEARLLAVNERFCEIVGYSADELIGRRITELSHPDDRERGYERHREIMRGSAGDATFERRYIRKDGSTVWARVTLRPVRTAGGDIQYVIGLVEDITARKMADEQLLRQARLLECVGEAIVAAALSGEVTYWSAHAETLTGWGAAEAIGRNIVDLVPEARGWVPEVVARVSGGDSWTAETLLTRRDGRRFVCEVKLSPIHDGQGTVVGVVAVATDVTQRRESESALQRQKALLSETQKIARMGSWEVDFISGHRFWSDAVFSLLGIPVAAEPPDAETAILRFVVADDQARVMRTWREMMAARSSFDIEFRIRRSDGMTRTLHVRGRTVAGDGLPVRMVGTVQDVTEQVEAAAELTRSAAERSLVATLRQVALGTRNPQLVVEQALSAVQVMMDSDWAGLIVREGGRARIANATEALSDDVLPAGPGSFVAHLMDVLSPVAVADLAAQREFDPPRVFLESGLQGVAAAPIAGGEEGVGSLIVAAARAGRDFPRRDVEFLQAVANILAHSFASARTDEELRARVRQQRALAMLGQSLLGGITDRTFQQVCDFAMEGLDVEHSCVFEVTDERTSIVARAGTFWRRDDSPYVIDERSHAGLTARSGEPVVIEDYGNAGFDAAEFFTSHGIVSGMTVPIGPQANFGVLTAQSKTRRRFSRSDVDFMLGLANTLAEALERHRAEQERIRLTTELGWILESTDEGIYAIDRDGRCLRVNRAAANILGYEPEELVGLQIHELIHYMHADGTPFDAAECVIASTLSTGESVRRAEDVFWRRDGTAIPVEFNASPIRAGGEIHGTVVTFADVSERRKLHQQLEQANRLTSLGRLAATIAHEFNNVLMGISPFLDILRRERVTDAQRTTAIEQMTRAVRRGKGITEDILRFARPVEPTLASIEVGDWLASVVSEARQMLPSRVALLVQPHDRALTMRADAGKLHQVFVNMILNARDAMADGGTITISVRREEPGTQFTFGAVENVERHVHFSVADTGAGMSEETLRHAFEPLFTTKRHGTGLGLAVAHQVVTRQGGAVFAESIVGKGTTFHVFIPSTDEASPSTREVSRSRVRTRVSRVLIVEDEPAVARGLAAALELEGITSVTVAEGRLALDAADRTRPDAAIVDLHLPDMDGVEVYRILSRNHPELPIIFSTGHGDERSLEEFLANPHVKYLRKPYELDTLLTVLEDVTSAPRGEQRFDGAPC